MVMEISWKWWRSIWGWRLLRSAVRLRKGVLVSVERWTIAKLPYRYVERSTKLKVTRAGVVWNQNVSNFHNSTQNSSRARFCQDANFNPSYAPGQHRFLSLLSYTYAQSSSLLFNQSTTCNEQYQQLAELDIRYERDSHAHTPLDEFCLFRTNSIPPCSHACFYG